MQHELPLLIKLQTLDSGLDDAHRKAEALDPLIKKKNQDIDDLKHGLKEAKEKIASFQLKKKGFEGEAEEKEKLIKKHQAALNALKSNDAYKAMLGEIQTAKTDLNKIEDDLLTLMEAIEKAELDYKNIEKKLKNDETLIKGEIQALETEKAADLILVESKRSERDTFAATLPSPLKAQYETIRERKGGIAIVPMVNFSCGGCHMSLTQNKILEIRKAKDMVLCDSCMRILYLPHDPAAIPAPAPVEASPTQTQ